MGKHGEIYESVEKIVAKLLMINLPWTAGCDPLC